MKWWRMGGLAAALAALVVAGVVAWRSTTLTPGAPSADASSSVGGPFVLRDQTGAPVNESLLRGKWSAVFFGYTFCPDVCPTTLAKLGQAVGGLGGRADRFQVVFITVDPARDSPAALATYLSSPAFPKGTRGLTGSDAQIATVAKAYHVYYQKAPQGDSYTMDHSAVVYLMNPSGQFVRPLDMSVTPPDIARQVLTAMDGGSTS